jgi:AcrR family transcriptional regulator
MCCGHSASTPDSRPWRSREATSTRRIIDIELEINTTGEQIVDGRAELLRRQGYAATGIKQIVTGPQGPFGSLYHFFPGGKERLGAEAIRVSGKLYQQLIPAVLDVAPGPVAGVRMLFAGAARHLIETDER